MPLASVNGIELYYETRGEKGQPCMLLIGGLGSQLISWSDLLIEAFLIAGFRVVRFDNRDSGLSSKLEDGLNWAVTKTTFISSYFGRQVESPYRLSDMADDALGLLSHLGIDKAHVVGVSMGGMIAQLMAYQAPERCLSLTCLMSSSGSRAVPMGKLKSILRLGRQPKSNKKEDVVAHIVESWRLHMGQEFRRDLQRLREYAKRAFERCYCPAGSTRQFRAILNDGSRVERLQTVTTPTLAIHGTADPLVHPAGSKDIVRQVQNGKLKMIDGLGHDLPDSVVPIVSELVIEHAQQAMGADIRD